MQLEDYLALFPGASREKPLFMALAEALLRQTVDLMALAAALQPGFSFAAAAGKQLDDLASAVGLKRSDAGAGASDSDFRQFLLAKLVLWTWDGTNENAPAALSAQHVFTILFRLGRGRVRQAILFSEHLAGESTVIG